MRPRIFLALTICSGIFLTSILFVSSAFPNHLRDVELSGSAYVVNKESKSVTVVELSSFTVEDEIQLSIEPHEASSDLTARVVVSNYGNHDEQGRTISIIDHKSKSVLDHLDMGENTKPHDLEWILGTELVAVANDMSNEIILANIKSGDIIRRFRTGQLRTHMLDVDTNRKRIYAVNQTSKSITVINYKSLVIEANIHLQIEISDAAVQPDGAMFWVLDEKTNAALVIDAKDFSVQKRIQVGANPKRIRFTPNGKRALITNFTDGSVSILDTDSKREMKRITIPGKRNYLERIFMHTPTPIGLLVHPDGRYALIANSNAHQLVILDITKGKLMGSINVGKRPDGIAYVRDQTNP